MQESTHNFIQVSVFLWFYVMLFYLSIYFGLFYELFEPGLEKGIFLVILMFRVFCKNDFLIFFVILMFTILVKIIPDCI